MISVNTQQFNLLRILLLTIGLWPYQRSRLVQCQTILSTGLLNSVVLLQLTVFITTEFTFNLGINVFCIASLCTMFAITYNYFWFNLTKIGKIPLETLQHIFNGLKDDNEIIIMNKYGDFIQFITIGIIVLYICGISIILTIVSIPILPNSIGLVLHINKFQSLRMICKLIPKYLVDQEKYLYLIVLYTLLIIYIGTTAITTTGIVLITYCTFCCGMFKVASYRIEKAINMRNNICLKNVAAMHKEVVYAVDFHHATIEFLRYLFACLHTSNFILIVVGVFCLSGNLYALSEIILHGDDINQTMLHFTIILIIFIYLFAANYLGQELTEHNNDVFFAIYNTQWYKAPLPIQRLVLFFLQRCTKVLTFDLGGVSTLSLEFFATLMKASMSYVTIMYSTQQ